MIHMGWKRFTLLQFHRLQRHHDWNVQINIVIVVLSGQNERKKNRICEQRVGIIDWGRTVERFSTAIQARSTSAG